MKKIFCVFALVCVFAGCRKVDPGYDGFEAVDLGIGVKWATRNLGATAPEEFGDYFAWGETEPKKQYTWSSYKFHMGGSKTENVIFSKYNPGGTRWGLVDGKSVLDPEDDAAIVRLGGKWRMPTEEDARKLLDFIPSRAVHCLFILVGIRLRIQSAQSDGRRSGTLHRAAHTSCLRLERRYSK